MRGLPACLPATATAIVSVTLHPLPGLQPPAGSAGSWQQGSQLARSLLLPALVGLLSARIHQLHFVATMPTFPPHLQTPQVSAAVIARVFLDPQLRWAGGLAGGVGSR